MRAIFIIIDTVLAIYVWVIIASAVFSWLFAFNVVNPRNQVVAAIGNALYQLTEPVLRPLRRYVPVFGGLDISPIIVILVIMLIRMWLWDYVIPYAP